MNIVRLERKPDFAPDIRLAVSAQSANEIDDDTYQQNQTKPSSADGGATKIKTAAAEHKKKNKYEKYRIHSYRIALRFHRRYGVFPYQGSME